MNVYHSLPAREFIRGVWSLPIIFSIDHPQAHILEPTSIPNTSVCHIHSDFNWKISEVTVILPRDICRFQKGHCLMQMISKE